MPRQQRETSFPLLAPRESPTTRQQRRTRLEWRRVLIFVVLLIAGLLICNSGPAPQTTAVGPGAPPGQLTLAPVESSPPESEPRRVQNDSPPSEQLPAEAAAEPFTASPPPVDQRGATTPTVISLYSPFADRFICVGSDNTLRADTEYPWSEACWFRLLHLTANLSINTAVPEPSEGRRLGVQPSDGSTDAALVAAGTRSHHRGDAAADEAEMEEELWEGEELSGQWFALISEANGRIIRLYGGDAGGKAWTAVADTPPPTARHRSRAERLASLEADATDGAAHRAARRRGPMSKRQWSAPPGCAWTMTSERLRNRGTGGFLNVRSGGHVRGHGNSGPPWRAADLESESSSVVTPRAVPSALRTPLTRRYQLLSVDYHIATAQDVGHTLREHGQTFVEKSLSGACRRRRTCVDRRELPVLTVESAFTLCPQPHSLRRAAYQALRTSPLLTSADGVVCSHPAALCEVWLPFNKSILLIVTANLELARENHERWKEWLRTVVALASSPRAVVAANNRYDQAYVEHFTGIRPVYLPTLANYITARYRPVKGQPVLMTRSHHDLGRRLLRELKQAARAHAGLKVSSVEEFYAGSANGGGYEYSQLTSHPAVIVVPYTKSTMTFFELYRMAIPIFVPSLKLLVKWELHRHVLSERVYWKHAPSPLRRPPTPNPNELQNRAAVEHWVALSDPYVYPHIQYFDSAEDLASKLSSVDLKAVSARMRKHSAQMAPVMRQKWRAVLRKLFEGRPSGSWPSGAADGFEREIRTRFGLTVGAEEPDCSRLSAPELGQWN